MAIQPAKRQAVQFQIRKLFNKEFITIGASIVFLLLAIFIETSGPIAFGFYLISYLLVGSEILMTAVRNIFRGEIFDENLLMSIATLGAFAIGEYREGVAVMLLYQIGEYLHSLAVNHSRRSIKSLLDIRPDYAHKKTENGLVTLTPNQIDVGEEIIVKPGERIPLDGLVIEGNSTLDTSALTGESMPRYATAGDEVFSGSINNTGVLTIRVTKNYEQSTASKIIELVESAADNKASTEKFITRFARYYTPVVVLLALGLFVLPPLLISGATFSQWGYRSLVFLIISCPCALVVSIPLSFFGGIGTAARHGVLVKGSNYLDSLTQTDAIAFDKTGTLTKGTFSVTQVVPQGLTEAELLELAAYAESYSNHPIATSIKTAYGKNIDQSKISDYHQVTGKGILASINGKKVIVGNAKIMTDNNIDFSQIKTTGSIVYIAVDQEFVGHITIEDSIKPDAAIALQQLRELGIKNLYMLTGDNTNVAKIVGEELKIAQVYSQLLPDDKVKIVDQLIDQGAKLAFAGDGINDAPVLARADVGIAMGGLGSDAAIEAADIVLMTDELAKLPTGIKIAKYTKKIVYQNIGLALGVKVLFLLLGALGVANLWEAIFADVGITIIAVINATRILAQKFHS